MTKEPEYIAKTLAWCNRYRAKQGLEPLDRLPKGKRSDPRSCPCAEATGLVVTKTYDILPSYVITFVKLFDDGRLPQYDSESESESRVA